MTDQIPTENTLPTGAQGSANPAASQSVGAGTSQGADSMPEWFKPYAKRLDESERIARGKQSEADKATAALNKQVKRDFKQEIDTAVNTAVEELGLSPQQADQYRRRLMNDEVQRRVLYSDQPDLVAPASPGSGTPSAASIGSLELLQIFGLQDNDQEVLNALRDAGNDTQAAAANLRSLVVRRAAAPQPTAASTPPPAGGSGVPQKSADQLTADYKKDMQAARGNKSLLRDTRIRYANLGVNVHDIDFT